MGAERVSVRTSVVPLFGVLVALLAWPLAAPALAEACDRGMIERVSAPWLEPTVDLIERSAK